MGMQNGNVLPLIPYDKHRAFNRLIEISRYLYRKIRERLTDEAFAA